MKSSLPAWVLLSSTVSLAAAGDYSPSLDPSITGVLMDRGTGTRALTGDRGGAYLGVERISGDKVTGQAWIDEIRLDGSAIPVASLKNVRLLSLASHKLTFDAQPAVKGARDRIECGVNLVLKKGEVRIDATVCRWAGTPTPPPPPPRPGTPTKPPMVKPPPAPPPAKSVADLAALSRACKEVFDFDDEVRRCADLGVAMFEQSAWSSSTFLTIRACGDGLDFGDDGLACIELSTRATREPAATVRHCTTSEHFRDDQLACIAKHSAKP